MYIQFKGCVQTFDFERIFEQQNYSMSHPGQHLDTGCPLSAHEDHGMINVCRDLNNQEGVEGGWDGMEWKREMDGEEE